MSEPTHPIARILIKDKRYPVEAYDFFRDALSYAQDVLELGAETHEGESANIDASLPGQSRERHLTGQQLCEAIRDYAIHQYGYMAQVVLREWGITSTSDFGDIAYNMIGMKLLKKSKDDRREDFDNVYDFETAFRREFRIVHGDQDE